MRHRLWLWILTFVTMTEEGDVPRRYVRQIQLRPGSEGIPASDLVTLLEAPPDTRLGLPFV
jgi:hypothetical protein